MKLISDSGILPKNRRAVRFMLEDTDDALETAIRLTALFTKANAVVTSPFGEHRIPAEICQSLENMKKALGDVAVLKIDIGEGEGTNDVSFCINRESAELTCLGPLDFDFYSALTGIGLYFKL